MKQRDEILKEFIRKTAGEFIQKESNYTSLVTITDVSLAERGKRSTIFFTVLPEKKEETVLDFLKRKRTLFRKFFKNKARMRTLPFFDFAIDKGEKNRQHIDE